MKIVCFNVKVAVPNYIEDVGADDLYALFEQKGDERMDLHECAWEVETVPRPTTCKCKDPCSFQCSQ